MAGFFARLKEGLTKTRNNMVGGLDGVFNGHTKIDDDFYEELEEILVMGDVGIHATEEILDKLKVAVKENRIKQPLACRDYLVNLIKEQMRVSVEDYDFLNEPSIVMVIGVNGVGKTTTIGKLAAIYRERGKKVLIAAADTFRAAATEQLEEWAKRADVDIIKAYEGADPSSVIYDAVNAARARKIDVLLCDTAGRLHNKKNLMNELEKMNRIIDKNYPDIKRENLIVLDGTTGQNALVQAREFSEAAPLSGIVLTKMDGTAKGGIAIAIQSELGIPVKFIGVGEGINDLQEFDSDAFVNALFDIEDKNEKDTDTLTDSDPGEGIENESEQEAVSPTHFSEEMVEASLAGEEIDDNIQKASIEAVEMTTDVPVEKTVETVAEETDDMVEQVEEVEKEEETEKKKGFFNWLLG